MKRGKHTKLAERRFVKCLVVGPLELLPCRHFSPQFRAIPRQECSLDLGDFVSCNSAAIRVQIRIVRCERPAKRQKHKPCETKARFFSPLLLVGSQESVSKVPKRGQFHAAIRVTTKKLRAPGRELIEILLANYLCATASPPSFPQNSPSLAQNSETVPSETNYCLRKITLKYLFSKKNRISHVIP